MKNNSFSQCNADSESIIFFQHLPPHPLAMNFISEYKWCVKYEYFFFKIIYLYNILLTTNIRSGKTLGKANCICMPFCRLTIHSYWLLMKIILPAKPINQKLLRTQKIKRKIRNLYRNINCKI